MACYLKQKGISRTVYGFDSFEGFAESVSNDLTLGGEHPEWKHAGVMNETSLELVQGKARRFGLKNLKLVKGFFENTLPAYSGRKFSLVHLDCDTYNDPPWPGCNKALDDFLADKSEKLQMMSLDNHEKYYLVKQG